MTPEARQAINAYSREWYWKNREHRLAYMKEWRKKNRDRTRQYNERAKEKMAGDPIVPLAIKNPKYGWRKTTLKIEIPRELHDHIISVITQPDEVQTASEYIAELIEEDRCRRNEE